ncbi:predicted protein [Histoplasma capsulatum H143]|uniref:Uncharacterized protein n=1 Tax=Ajellomyces capsulatus (strain H143) TaxID=544712 RepID=C6H922_AJECH|nr:predicted protein [Histoplasma capsulatum H143]
MRGSHSHGSTEARIEEYGERKLNNHWERRQSDPRAGSQSERPVVSFECGESLSGSGRRILEDVKKQPTNPGGVAKFRCFSRVGVERSRESRDWLRNIHGSALRRVWTSGDSSRSVYRRYPPVIG